MATHEETQAAAGPAGPTEPDEPQDTELPDADGNPEPTAETAETTDDAPPPTSSGDPADDSAGNAADDQAVPGPRAARLQALLASSLGHTLGKVSWANFAACYPTAAARNPTALRAVHGALVARLQELCAAEFARVLRARQVVAKLNELEGLAAAASARRAAAAAAAENTSATPTPPPPPHTLPPATVLAAHLRPSRQAQRDALAARLRASQAANAARCAQLAAQQAEAEQLVGALERALADAASAAALLDGDGLMRDLARETRAAETEMGC